MARGKHTVSVPEKFGESAGAADALPKEQSPVIKKFTLAAAFLAAAGLLLGCAHVRQEDLAE